MVRKLLNLLFPPKCVLCQRVLTKEEVDFCKSCNSAVVPLPLSKHKLRHITKWSALWRYEVDVRESIIRFKFSNRPTYGTVYGKYLAEKILSDGLTFDIITSVPISKKRKWRRGYDQTRIIAEAIASATGKPYAETLQKVRHTQPQSLLHTEAQRRANILGSYCVINAEEIKEKSILLIDDVVTTGSTVSECARVLLTAGAKNVSCGAVASAIKNNHVNR